MVDLSSKEGKVRKVPDYSSRERERERERERGDRITSLTRRKVSKIWISFEVSMELYQCIEGITRIKGTKGIEG